MSLCIFQQLNKKRQEKGIAQEKMAQIVGVSLRTWQRWEKKGTTPSPMAKDRIKRVLEAL